jgi:hypothetical protein
VVALILLDMLLRPWAERLLAGWRRSPLKEFRLKIWAVAMLCILSLACCVCGAVTSFKING